jgi:hypothetical protein
MSAEGRVAPGMMSFSGAVSEYGARQGRKVCPIFCLTTGVHPNSRVQLGSKPRRFAAKGTRAVCGSLDEETATREVTARNARLDGKAQIVLKTTLGSPTSSRST